MTLYRRGGSYCVSVYDPVCKAMLWVGSFATESEARAAEAGASRPVTCADYQARWLRAHPRPAPATNRTYERRTRPFARRFGDLPIAELDSPEVAEWAASQDWSVWEASRTLLNDAIKDGLHPGPNPFAGIRQRVFTRNRVPRPRSLVSRTQVFELADRAIEIWGRWGYEVFAPLIITIAHVNLRPLQVISIRREDIEDEYVVVSDELRAPSRIELPPEARQAIALVPTLDGVPWVFTTKQCRRFTQSSLSAYWIPVRAAAGLPDLRLDELRFHSREVGSSQSNEE